MQIMTTKIRTLQTLYVHVVLNSATFPPICSTKIMLNTFLPVKFFPKYYFNDLLQNVTWTDE